MKEIIIAKAQKTDISGTQKVFYDTWLTTYPNSEVGITKEDVEEKFKNAFSAKTLEEREKQLEALGGNTTFLVAKDKDRVVGVCLAHKRENVNQLQAIYVLPEYQRQGIGGMFWEELKKFFDPSKNTIVQVATYNTQAIDFYQQLGFVDTGRRLTEERHRMPVSGVLIPEMEMVLRVEE